MLRSLPVRDPQQLVSVGGLDPEHPEHGSGISLAMLNKIREHARAFSDVFIWDGGGISNFDANGAGFPAASIRCREIISPRSECARLSGACSRKKTPRSMRVLPPSSPSSSTGSAGIDSAAIRT